MTPSVRSWADRLAGVAGPAYLSLADGIAEAVRCGELPTGSRLPPQRDLARQLGLDVTTVSRAIREAQRRGLVITRGRAGSFIAPRAAPGNAASSTDLSVNFPPPLEPADEAAIRAVMVECAGRMESRELFDYPRQGLTGRHRQAGAQWCAGVGIPVDEGRIVVAGGAQQALLGIIAQLCQPGDAILTEALTYPGMIAIAQRAGLRIIGLAQDDQGVLPEAVEEACRRGKPKLIYLVPTFQNPTTATATPERRAALAAAIRRGGLTLIEDDGHAALLEPTPVPIATLIPERSYYVSGLSKCISPGLRTAYLVAPSAAAAGRLNATLVALGQFPAPLAAAIASEVVLGGVGVAATSAMRRQAARRWEVATALLPELQSGIARTNHFGWLPLPARWRSDAFAGRARGQGVGVTPASAFAVGTGAAAAGVRVCLGAADSVEQLGGALTVLAGLLFEDPAQIRPFF